MKMKKIGCVIAYRKNHTNYGTSLVGYALLQKVQQLGFQVEVINYIKHLSILQKINYVINAFRCGEMKNIISRLMRNRTKKKYPQYAHGIAVRTRAVENYKLKKICPLFRDYFGFKALQEGSKNYDAVLVGSDQVWMPLSLPNKYFNLLFVDDSVRKVAYGSSFGVSIIPKFQRKATGVFLNRFYRIGVREQKGKEIVDGLSNQTAQVVADPTMLLNADEWRKEIFLESECATEPYIFCYFLGSNKKARQAANELKAKTGYKIITLRHMDEYVPDDESFGDEAPYDVDPNGFLRLIHNAEYVCTDSFHCSAFSIQFHKRFMTFYRFAQNKSTGRNSRIDSLFNILGIDRKHIYQGKIDDINAEIKWNDVDERLKELRNNSISFLRESLA